MTLKYFIVKGKNKNTSIHVRFWDSTRIDQKAKSGLSVLQDDWSDAKQRFKPKATTAKRDYFNDQLEQLERFIIDQYNFDYSSKKFTSTSWLKDAIKSFFGRVENDENYKVYFVDWIILFLEDAHKRIYKGKPIAIRTIKNYKTALNKLKEFEKFKNHKYRFEEIDLKFHRDFIHFCTENLNLNNNSTGTLINRIRTFCSNIEMDGYKVNPQYKHRDFSSPTNETRDIYLNDSEIDQLIKHDFSNSIRLDNARDLFIIGLRTGLRVSDFLKINKNNILRNIINVTTQKTNQNLFIPIHPQFQSILDKRNGEFPTEISDRIFNLAIKEICEIAGISEKTSGAKINSKTSRKEFGIYRKFELVTSHICRRSFATNLFLAKFDNATIMKATGHQSESKFLKYIKATDEEHLQKISEYWANQTLKS
jgi:site-specific recombinase XerD